MINVHIPVENIAESLTKDDLNTIMAEFSDNDLVECIVQQDKERADWIISDGLVKMLKAIANDLDNEIEDALDFGDISKDTYNVFKLLKDKK